MITHDFIVGCVVGGCVGLLIGVVIQAWNQRRR